MQSRKRYRWIDRWLSGGTPESRFNVPVLVWEEILDINSLGDRCPVCHARFASISKVLMLSELSIHYMTEHVTVEDVMRAIDRKERVNG